MDFANLAGVLTDILSKNVGGFLKAGTGALDIGSPTIIPVCALTVFKTPFLSALFRNIGLFNTLFKDMFLLYWFAPV